MILRIIIWRRNPSRERHVMCLPSPRARTADLAGIALSSACLVHCLALPLALLVAPALGNWLRLPDGVHAAILMIALPTAAIAINGGRQRHGHNAPTLLAVAGISFLAAGLAAHEDWLALPDAQTADRLLTSLGAVMLATTHLVNRRRRHDVGEHPG